MLAYYFCRLFPTEKGGIPLVNPHPFTEADTLKRVEDYDNMKKPTDLSLALNPSLSSSLAL